MAAQMIVLFLTRLALMQTLNNAHYLEQPIMTSTCQHQEKTHHSAATWGGAASATVHCLTGCAIGEFAGLAIGVQLGLAPASTMVLATLLAFVSGYALTIIPFVKRGVSFVQALKTVWLGELISISVMELAMNYTDYQMGGMNVDSLIEPLFWGSYAAALVAGFLAAWPINYVLLKRNLKNCH